VQSNRVSVYFEISRMILRIKISGMKNGCAGEQPDAWSLESAWQTAYGWYAKQAWEYLRSSQVGYETLFTGRATTCWLMCQYQCENMIQTICFEEAGDVVHYGE